MNKSILITGSSQRIGRELCLYFASKGWNIAIHFNKSKKKAIALKNEIQKYGVKCFCLQANLLNSKKIKKIIIDTKKELGNIDCIINNASIFDNDDILNFNEKNWNNHIKINLLAPAILIKEFSGIIFIYLFVTNLVPPPPPPVFLTPFILLFPPPPSLFF